VHVRDRDARELRSVAPLLANGKLVGAVTLVHNAGRTIGVADAELLRPHVGAELTVATKLDGSQVVAVGHWGLSRNAGLGLIELAAPVERGLDVRPLELGAVCGTVDPHGAQSALIGIVSDGAGFARAWVPVAIDRDDSAGSGNASGPLASPLEDAHVGLNIDGASLFAWFPPIPALRRASEVALLGMARAYRGFAKPRERPVIAEIVGLDDLGRALIAGKPPEEREPELSQVAGEIMPRGRKG
jgi:hypothetical protein